MDPAAIAALSGAGGAVVGAVSAWRKSGNESEAIAVTTLRSVIEELRAELDRKVDEIDTMRDKLDKLDRNLSVLSDMPPGHLG
jgi:chromosome segregation ATPase